MATHTRLKIAVNEAKNVRSVMRRHLRAQKRTMGSLSEVWGIKPDSCERRFYKENRAMPVQYVTAFIKELKLDPYDALELQILGARESGWKIPLKILQI